MADPFDGMRRRGMYPLGMTRPLAVAVASRPSRHRPPRTPPHSPLNPRRPATGRGDRPLHRRRFIPSSLVNLTRDGALVSPFPTDGPAASTPASGSCWTRGAGGAPTRRATRRSGAERLCTGDRERRGVGLSPFTGPVSRRFRIRARGFTTGQTLWAARGAQALEAASQDRQPEGLVPQPHRPAAPAPEERPLRRHRIQFDTFRRYREEPRCEDLLHDQCCAGWPVRLDSGVSAGNRRRRLVELTGERRRQRG